MIRQSLGQESWSLGVLRSACDEFPGSWDPGIQELEARGGGRARMGDRLGLRALHPEQEY